MTRETIIELVLSQKENAIPEIKDALDTIIKALKQDPCEDAISRKDIIAKIEDEYEGYMLSEDATPQDFVYMIMDMPSIRPKQKTGHWIKYSNGDVCSECGYDTGKYEDGKHYCPKCGAKMEGSK